jgi:hypothetical protein
MATRSTAHAGEEKAIFDAFVAAHPSFGAQIKNVEQPDAEFPDVIVELKNGTFIDFELGEWLDGAQMAGAKRYDALAKAMIDTLGPQDTNPSRHFRAVMLTPREDAVALSGADRGAFRAQIWALVSDTAGGRGNASGTRHRGGFAGSSMGIRSSRSTCDQSTSTPSSCGAKRAHGQLVNRGSSSSPVAARTRRTRPSRR